MQDSIENKIDKLFSMVDERIPVASEFREFTIQYGDNNYILARLKVDNKGLRYYHFFDKPIGEIANVLQFELITRSSAYGINLLENSGGIDEVGFNDLFGFGNIVRGYFGVTSLPFSEIKMLESYPSYYSENIDGQADITNSRLMQEGNTGKLRMETLQHFYNRLASGISMANERFYFPEMDSSKAIYITGLINAAYSLNIEKVIIMSKQKDQVMSFCGHFGPYYHLRLPNHGQIIFEESNMRFNLSIINEFLEHAA